MHIADGVLHIGALTTHRALTEDSLVRERLTALADASAIVGSHATRAQGTLGGNVMNASPAMETGGPLLCLGARVRLHSSAGATRTLTIDELLVGPGRTVAQVDELLEAIEVPLPAEGTGSCYLRLEYRRQMEIAVVGATAVVTLVDGLIADARIAITALAPTIRRVPAAEAALTGSDGGVEACKRAADAVAAASKPISDVRASSTYRTAMAAVIGRRAIEAALARARGGHVPIPASPALHGGLR
jgi:CO/xanthine dehydrogenase FAD-binding subunit